MRIEPLYEEFLSYLLVERNCSPLTVQAYRSDGRSFIEAFDELGLPHEVQAVGKQVIRSYVVLLRNRGLGLATIARRLHSLRSFWNYLWDNDYAKGNPVRLVSLPRRARRLPVHLSEEECRLVLTAAREQRSSFLACRDTALLTFLLMTGARRAEVLNLTWRDVDLSQLIVRFRRAKGDKTRVVPLAAEVAEALTLWREMRPECEHDYVFTTQWGARLGRRGIRSAHWSTSTVKRLLRNCVHAGLIAVADEKGNTTYLHGEHYEQRIYDPELFHRIVARMERIGAQGPGRDGKVGYLFGGLITCGHCGYRLNGRMVGRLDARYYRCSTGSQQCDPECGRNAERADFVEALVLQELRRLAANPELRLAALANVGQMLAEEREEIKQEMDRLESRMQKLWDGYMFWSREREEGRCEPDEFDRHVTRFRDGKAEVEARLAELKRLQAGEAQRRAVMARAQELVADFEASWDNLPVVQRRELVQKVVESAIMSHLPDGRTEVTFTLRGFEPVTRRIDRRSRADRPEHGPANLTDAQEGLDRAGIARRRSIRWATANMHLWQARTKLGAAALEEAWEIAGSYIEANLHRLPLECRKRRPGAKPADGSPCSRSSKSTSCLWFVGA